MYKYIYVRVFTNFGFFHCHVALYFTQTPEILLLEQNVTRSSSYVLGVIPPLKRVYIHIRRIPIEGWMTIPLKSSTRQALLRNVPGAAAFQSMEQIMPVPTGPPCIMLQRSSGMQLNFLSRLMVDYGAEVKVNPVKGIAQRIARVFVDERAAGANMLALRLFLEYVIGADFRFSGIPTNKRQKTFDELSRNIVNSATTIPRIRTLGISGKGDQRTKNWEAGRHWDSEEVLLSPQASWCILAHGATFLFQRCLSQLQDLLRRSLRSILRIWLSATQRSTLDLCLSLMRSKREKKVPRNGELSLKANNDALLLESKVTLN